MVLLFRNFGANPIVSAGNETSADDDRMQVDSLKKGKGKIEHQTRNEVARPARPTRALQTSTRARTVAEFGHWRRTAGDQEEERTTIPQVTTSNTQKGKGHKKGTGKSKHVDVVETNQPLETASAVAYASQTPSTVGDLSCNSNVEPWIMGVTINSVSTRRQAGAQLHASRTKGTVA